jgi:type I restriction enzyme R subunit
MKSNFSYLKQEGKYKSFAGACVEAEKLMHSSYSASATFTRRAMELAVRWIYINDEELTLPYNETFAALINSQDFKDIVGIELYKALNYSRDLGNKAAHTNRNVTREQATLSLRNLFNLTNFIEYCYSESFEEREFDESILGQNEKLRKTSEEQESFEKLLAKKEESLEELIKENQKLREENKRVRKHHENTRPFKIDSLSEEETRKAYIDLDLELKGWEIGSNCLVEVEVSQMKNASGVGFVDYVLYGDDGKPLAVVEAKRTSKSPKLGKAQAAMYADALEKESGVRPVIFYTNGIEYYIWDDVDSPERRVSGIYSKKDLESLNFIKQNRTPMKVSDIRDKITNRDYQKEAIIRTLEDFEKGHRKGLLVMATGSGKTRTAISIIDVMVKNNWAKNILFLADRTALVKQAKQSFSEHLPELSLCNLLDNRDDVNSRMIFSTYPTMMNAIDERKGADGKRIFTNGHFDLIILDESHRSIYKKYQDIFEYFDARLLGLTATPVDEIDRNTYRTFELEEGNPTFAYELVEAIEDGYLVPYKLAAVSETRIMSDGVKYGELSEEEKEAFEDTFEEREDIPSEMVNKTLFNKETVDLVIKDLMERGIKVEGGDKLGKTVVFAANQAHADFIIERFNGLYPEFKGGFAQAVYHKINYVDNLIDKFKDGKSNPQIAVSVDMLDTGIDVPELVNLVFFKKLRSKAKFWQMIGRGTRLCKDLFGPGLDKKKFLIFDYYYNFEFFEETPDGFEGGVQGSLTENLFCIKVDLIKGLEHLDYQEKEFVVYRDELVEDLIFMIKNVSGERFSAEMRRHLLDKYSDKRSYESLGTDEIKELKEEVAGLVISMDEDELAKRFDYLMYNIQLAYMEKKSFAGPMNRVKRTAQNLAKKGSIVQVEKKKDLIYAVQENEFWKEAGLADFERVREELRELIKLIDRKETDIYYTDFRDEVVGVKEERAIWLDNSLGSYKERVEAYFKKYKDNIAIYKLRNNKELSEDDMRYFEKVLFEELGDEDAYREFYGERPLLKLVASITGMEREVARSEFSAFLTDENLNSDQINFVNKIVNHIVENGFMEKEVLQEYPFTERGSVMDLFHNKIDVVRGIISIIDKINSRLAA